jgi:hypothetical protein
MSTFARKIRGRAWLVAALVLGWAGCSCAPEPDAPFRDPECTYQLCRLLGRCTYYGRDGCIVGSDADCRKSLPCKYEGRCTWVKNTCMVGSDADCQQSDDCADHGWCARVESGACRARTDADCAQSVDCYRYGRCVLGASGCTKPRDE